MFDAEKVKQEINEQLALWGQTSMGFGVIKDGEVVLADGFGMADEEKGLRSNADTLYQIGSCSKAFTAAAMAKCVDDGLADWDDPVIKYLPWFSYKDPAVTPRVTIRDMLCHRTGLPRHDAYWTLHEVTRREMAESMKNMNACWSLRNTWYYNNFCFVVVGLIIEKLSGMTWEEFVKEKLLKPIGMNRTFFYVDDLLDDENAAAGYQEVFDDPDRKYKKVDYLRFESEDRSKGVGAPFGPAGSIISCVNDMLKWASFNLNLGKVGDKQIISEASMKEITRPQMLLDAPLGPAFEEMDFHSYGFGWFIESYRGHKMVEHGGSINGMSAFVCTIPDQNLGIVALVNFSGGRINYAEAYNVCDDFLEAEQKDWNEAFRELKKKMLGPGSFEDAIRAALEAQYGKKISGIGPTHPLEAYVGTYENEMYGRAVISLQDDRLYFEIGRVRSVLENYHYDTFLFADKDSELYGLGISFRIDKCGEIRAFETDIAEPAETEVFKKTGEYKHE